MKELVVISGKGGTGKTSITASLAYLAGLDAIVADCDVDAADMHLLLNPTCSNTEDFYSGEVATIDNDMCIECGKCKDICRFDAIVVSDFKYSIDPISCEGCGYCSKICPVEAITNHERLVGQMYVSDVRTGTKMVHAKLGIGADNSGKLVAYVKKKSKEIAKLLKKEYVIVDGSPGVGCPVISSLSGADLVLFVTEPSKSGFHDLKRVIELVEKFKLQSVCIINKFDLNLEITEEIVAYLEQRQIDLVAKLPYNMIVSQMLSQGKILVETDNHISKEIMSAWKSIIEKMEK